jgi:hypothetical protein
MNRRDLGIAAIGALLGAGCAGSGGRNALPDAIAGEDRAAAAAPVILAHILVKGTRANFTLQQSGNTQFLVVNDSPNVCSADVVEKNGVNSLAIRGKTEGVALIHTKGEGGQGFVVQFHCTGAG